VHANLQFGNPSQAAYSRHTLKSLGEINGIHEMTETEDGHRESSFCKIQGELDSVKDQQTEQAFPSDGGRGSHDDAIKLSLHRHD
jgi:hypothetical protein